MNTHPRTGTRRQAAGWASMAARASRRELSARGGRGDGVNPREPTGAERQPPARQAIVTGRTPSAPRAPAQTPRARTSNTSASSTAHHHAADEHGGEGKDATTPVQRTSERINAPRASRARRRCDSAAVRARPRPQTSHQWMRKLRRDRAAAIVHQPQRRTTLQPATIVSAARQSRRDRSQRRSSAVQRAKQRARTIQ